MHTPPLTPDCIDREQQARDEVNVEFRALHITPGAGFPGQVWRGPVPGLQPGVGQGSDGGTLSWSGEGLSMSRLRSGPAKLELSGPAFKEQTQSCFNQKEKHRFCTLAFAEYALLLGPALLLRHSNCSEG